MADNLTAPATGAVLATDEVGGAHVQRIKPTFGGDGTATDVSSANPLPVVQEGAATEAKQDASNTLLTAIRDALGDDPTAAGLAAVVNALADNATGADIATIVAALAGTLTVDGSAVTQPVSADALPLPTGAATSAKQDTNTAAINKLGSAKRWFPITPDGNTDLATIPDAVYVGGAGDVVLKGSDGTNATFAATAGQVLPFSPTRVLATGTTATGLVGLVS